MENLIKAYQQMKQKQAQANVYLSDLQAREKELSNELAGLGFIVSRAEHQLSQALTSESLEKARAAVEEARKNEGNVKTLLKNIEGAINDTKAKLPTLHNDLLLAERDIWAAQRDRLIEEVKAHQAVLQLIIKAYAAAWQSGYRWDFDIFIREKIMGVSTGVDVEVLAQLKDEMTKKLWLDSDVKTLPAEGKDESTGDHMSAGIDQ